MYRQLSTLSLSHFYYFYLQNFYFWFIFHHFSTFIIYLSTHFLTLHLKCDIHVQGSPFLHLYHWPHVHGPSVWSHIGVTSLGVQPRWVRAFQGRGVV